MLIISRFLIILLLHTLGCLILSRNIDVIITSNYHQQSSLIFSSNLFNANYTNNSLQINAINSTNHYTCDINLPNTTYIPSMYYPYLGFGGIYNTANSSCSNPFNSSLIYPMVVWCYESLKLSSNSSLLVFGGMYTLMDNNPYTNSKNCPAGFLDDIILINLHVCQRMYYISDPINNFAGFLNYPSLRNLITNNYVCPMNYTMITLNAVPLSYCVNTSSSLVITNVINLNSTYFVYNSIVLNWAFLNTSMTNLPVTILMNNNIIVVTNSIVGAQYRINNLVEGTTYIFNVNNATIVRTTSTSLNNPFYNLGVGYLNYDPSLSFDGSSVDILSGTSSINVTTTNGYNTNEVNVGCVSLYVNTSLYYYGVVTGNFSFSFTAIEAFSTAGTVQFGIIYTTDLSNTSSILWLFTQYQVSAYNSWYDCTGYATFPTLMSVELAGNQITLTKGTSTYQYTINIPPPNSIAFIGLYMSGIQSSIVFTGVGLATTVPKSISSLTILPQPDIFNGYNPSNNYESVYTLSWTAADYTSKYIIQYQILGNNSSFFVLGTTSQPFYFLKTLSYQYNYLVQIIPTNIFGQGPILNYELIQTSSVSIPPYTTHFSNSSCGTRGIDYIAFNTFGTYLYQIPSTTSCTQQWIQVYGATGTSYANFAGGIGGFVSAITSFLPGQEIVIVVGEAGIYSTVNDDAAVGGGCPGTFGYGGGYSAVLTFDQQSMILVAGGGGAAFSNANGSSGFSTLNNNPTSPSCADSSSGFGGSPPFYYASSSNIYGNGGNGFTNFTSIYLSLLLSNSTSDRCISPLLQGMDGAVLISCISPSNTASNITLPQVESVLQQTISQPPILDPTMVCPLNSMILPPGSVIENQNECIPAAIFPPPTRNACPGSTTYYVSPKNGSNSYPGTSSQYPFATFSAIEKLGKNLQLVPGDTILFCRGYNQFGISWDVGPLMHYPIEWSATNCSVKFAAYICEEKYATEMPGLIQATVLPQITNLIGWQEVNITALNGSLISVLQYNTSLLNEIAPNFLWRTVPYGGLPHQLESIWVMGELYTVAQHPNYYYGVPQDYGGNMYGISFVEWFQTEPFLSVGNEAFFTPGGWCKHFWHDLFGENQTLVDSFMSQPYPFSETNMYVPGWFWFDFNQPMPGQVHPGTINCVEFLNKYVYSIWPDFDLNAEYAFVLDAILEDTQDKLNKTYWMTPYISNTDTNINYLNGFVGSQSGIPTVDANGNAPYQSLPSNITDTTVAGIWSYGGPFRWYGPCYFLDNPGEVCMNFTTGILQLIPINQKHKNAMLQTQTLSQAGGLPLDNTLVGVNRSAATTYVTGQTNGGYNPIMMYMYDLDCEMFTPNLEFQELLIGYGNLFLGLSIYNLSIHHNVFRYISIGTPQILTTYNNNEDGNCVCNTKGCLLNPATYPTSNNVYVFNNILDSSANGIALYGDSQNLLVYNNTIIHSNGGINTGTPTSRAIVRGNYLYDVAISIATNWPIVVDYTFMNSVNQTWKNQLYQYNIVNVTNNQLGSYSTQGVIIGNFSNNIINNTMIGYFFTQRTNAQNGMLFGEITYQEISHNIFENMMGGSLSVSVNVNWEYGSDGVQCIYIPIMNVTNNLIIDDWLQPLLSYPQEPWPLCTNVYETGLTIDQNYWIYLNVVPGHVEFDETASTLDFPYPSSGTRWTIAISSLQLVNELYYINQEDVSPNLPFRQSIELPQFKTPSLQLDPSFIPNQGFPGTNSITNYNNAIYFQDVILNSITQPNVTYFAGLTSNPQLHYGYNYVQNYTWSKMYQFATESCQEQQSTEQIYRQQVVNLFANYYVDLPCWPPIAVAFNFSLV